MVKESRRGELGGLVVLERANQVERTFAAVFFLLLLVVKKLVPGFES